MPSGLRVRVRVRVRVTLGIPKGDPNRFYSICHILYSLTCRIKC